MNISQQIKDLKQHIHQLEHSFHRQRGDVKLIAVSKGHPSLSIEQAFAAGIQDFAENYLQEAQAKMQALTKLSICWHFIGPIQSNKASSIARDFSWVHTVSRHKIAKQLNDARPESMAPLNVCLQVNIDNEETKAGVEPEKLAELASYVLQFPRLRLNGLMAIPKNQPDTHQQYSSFLRLKSLLQTLNQQLNIKLDTLSMGMSHDMPAAIHAGSTMVRIGTAIFGERKGSHHEN